MAAARATGVAGCTPQPRCRRRHPADPDEQGDGSRDRTAPSGPFGPGAPAPPDPARPSAVAARPRAGLRALVRAGVPRARPPGTPGRRHGARGRVDGRRHRRAEPAARDRELAGLPDLRGVPRHAERAAGELRHAPEPGLLGGADPPGRRSQHLPGRRPPGLHALRGGPAGGQRARPHRGRLREDGRQRRRALDVLAAGCDNLEGMLGTGTTSSSPGRATPRSSPTWCSRFDQDAAGGGPQHAPRPRRSG